MRSARLATYAVLASACGLAPIFVRAAAQLAAGAKTSARVTATNPQLRQIQITFDPSVAASTAQVYDVQAFQLGFTFNPYQLAYLPSTLTYIYPFTMDSPGSEVSGGYVDGVAGSASRTAELPSGDVDLFSVWFQLQNGLPLDTPVSVTFGAYDPSDFIRGINNNDPNNPASDMVSNGPTQITPATAVGVIGTPLPPGAWTGAATLAVIGMLGTLRRRTRACAEDLHF